MMKKVFCALLAVSMLMVLFGCAPSKQVVRLQEVTHSVFYAPQYIAMELGYFEDEGLTIELTNAGGADKAMAALLSGQSDIALMGPEASVYVYNEGRDDYTQVIGQITARDGAFIVGRAPDENFTLESLRGKSIIGGRKGGMPEMALEYALRQAGLEPGVDVDVMTHIQFNLMTGAFVGGEGDYVTAFEPNATQMQAEGAGYILASVGEFAGEIPYTCYQVTQSKLKKDSAMVEKFMKAIYRAQQFVQESDAKTVAEALQPAFSDTSVEVLTQVVERYREIGAFAVDPVLDQEPYERLLDVMEQAGELDARAPYEKVVNNSIAQKVMK